MALKSYNPTSPAQRGLILVDKSSLWKGKPVKALTEGKRKTGGRNNKAERVQACRRCTFGVVGPLRELGRALEK
jgi:ribosomal protein L2